MGKGEKNVMVFYICKISIYLKKKIINRFKMKIVTF